MNVAIPLDFEKGDSTKIMLPLYSLIREKTG